jgi:hypothetical protein
MIYVGVYSSDKTTVEVDSVTACKSEIDTVYSETEILAELEQMMTVKKAVNGMK